MDDAKQLEINLGRQSIIQIHQACDNNLYHCTMNTLGHRQFGLQLYCSTVNRIQLKFRPGGDWTGTYRHFWEL